MPLSAERISSQRGRLTLLNALASTAFSFVAINNAYEIPGRAPAYALLWAIWMSVTIIWVFGVPGWMHLSKRDRQVVNDELVRAHQAKAAKFGLACAFFAMVFASLFGFFHATLPEWTLPAATTGVVVLTALFFARLEMRDD